MLRLNTSRSARNFGSPIIKSISRNNSLGSSSFRGQRSHRTLNTQRKSPDLSLKNLFKNTQLTRPTAFRPVMHTHRQSHKWIKTESQFKSNTSNSQILAIQLFTGPNVSQLVYCTAEKIKDLINELRSYFPTKQIVAFRSKKTDINIDYYLTIPEAETKEFQYINLQLQPIYAEKQKNINLKSFQIVRCIGSGGFSKVYLVRFKEDGKFYAMKVIDKLFILKNRKKKIVMNQRNIMKDLNHPFIVKLRFSFQSQYSLIFIMEYYPGGQLFGLVRKFRRMPEGCARFYMTQILLGLKLIHSKNVIYRDFKPENIMIDRMGHVHIADFGLAKPISHNKDKAYSFCGSPQYMPPQMIKKEGHSTPVDFYCLGALLYELVTGLPPFYDKNISKISRAVLQDEITFPDNLSLSVQLRDLLEKLLVKDENYRLGTEGGVSQVLMHPWFKSVKIADYLSLNIKSPANFTSIRDFTFNSEEIGSKNTKYMNEILSQQKQETSETASQALAGFYYDWRQDQQSELKNSILGSSHIIRLNNPKRNFKRILRKNHSLSKVFTRLDNFF